MARECKFVVVVGKRGVGKSVETVRQIYQYIKGDPSKGIPPRKALIFDVNDEFSSFWHYGETHRIRALAIKDILKFTVHPKVEVRRIRPFWDNGKKMTIDDMGEVLGIILDTYRNGLLLVEDINKYTGDTMKMDLVGSLATSRHTGLDIIAHFQGVGRAGNPKLVGNMNMIRMHKTNDSVERHKNKFDDKFELLQIAQNIVNSKYDAGDKRYYLYADIEESKIRGKFTNQEVEQAIMDYIFANENSVIKPLLNKRDRKGNLLYTYETALTAAIKNLKDKYFSGS